MPVVVTGASGQFGRSAAEHLLRVLPPQEVVLTTRHPERLAAFAARGAQVRRADFDDPPQALAEAFRGADRMLLISASDVGRRVAQHGRAIAAAAAAGVRHVAYTSFVGVPGSAALVAGEHARTEELLRGSGLAWTALRNSWYMEAVTDVIAPMVLAEGVWRGSAAGGRAGMVSREDCAAAAVAVLTTAGHEGVAYAVTGPQALSCPEAAALIAEVSGRPLRYEQIDDDALYARFDALGVPRRVEDVAPAGIPWCSDDMVSFERAIREGDLAAVSDDVLHLTGTPPRTFREVLAARLPGAPAGSGVTRG